MFGVLKVVLLIAAVLAVWGTFGAIRRRQALARREGRPPERVRPPDPGPVEDMARCPVCTAFVPKRAATRCGRAGCPYG